MALRVIQSFLILFISVFSVSANAIIIGDKDWLQVGDVGGYNFEELDAVFDTFTGLCDVGDCRIGSSDVSDITWASEADVFDMLYNDLNVGANGMWAAFSLFTDTFGDGYTYYIDAQTRTLVGDDRATRIWLNITCELSIYVASCEDGTGGVASGPSSLAYNNNDVGAGWWMYRRIEVPEPTVVILLASGLIVFGVTRRQRRL